MSIDSSSPWLTWKVVSVLFELSLIGSVCATGGYWILIYEGWPTTWIDHYLHTVPMAVLFIDWHLNRILIEIRHVATFTILCFGYALFLITFTLSTGTYIYPFLDLKSLMSWLMLLGIVVIGPIVFALVTLYDRLKFWLFADSPSESSSSKMVSCYSNQHCLIVMD